MRKYIFAALMALCIAVPGTATASPVMSFESVESPEIAPQLVEAILRSASEQSQWSFGELYNWYNTGTITIEKAGSLYLVSQTSEGGIGEILIEEDF